MITIQPITTTGYTSRKPSETITIVKISIAPIRHPHPQPSSTVDVYLTGASAHSPMPHSRIVVSDSDLFASTTAESVARASSSSETSGTAAISLTR